MFGVFFWQQLLPVYQLHVLDAFPSPWPHEAREVREAWIDAIDGEIDRNLAYTRYLGAYTVGASPDTDEAWNEYRAADERYTDTLTTAWESWSTFAETYHFDEYECTPDYGTLSCDSNYSGMCIPIVDHDLDCSDIRTSFFVVGRDPHGFDPDMDGLACEDWK